MCGVVGATKAETAAEIAQQMVQRGTSAWSLTVVNLNMFTTCSGYQEEGVFSAERAIEAAHIWHDSMDETVAPFYILHLLSPTGTARRFHPAHADDCFLWHNGMMDTRAHSAAGRELWDTELFAQAIAESRPAEACASFQGAFAILLLRLRKGLYAARNRISPLFISDDFGTVASIQTKETPEDVPPGILVPIGSSPPLERFENTYNPFGV